MKILHPNTSNHKPKSYRLIWGFGASFFAACLGAFVVFGLPSYILEAAADSTDASVAKPEVVLNNAFSYIDRNSPSQAQDEIAVADAFRYDDFSSRLLDEVGLDEAFNYIDQASPSVALPETSLTSGFNYTDPYSRQKADAVLASAYDYIGPVISAVTPDRVDAFGGDSVTITGSFLQEGNRVFIGEIQAEILSESASSITVVAPANNPGPTDIDVVGQFDQTTTLEGGLTYEFTPSIESVSPAKGPEMGGQEITVKGAVFKGGRVQIAAAGRIHTLAIGSDNRIYGWGANNYGQLGSGDTENKSTPSLVTSDIIKGKRIIKLATAPDEHSLALDADGVMYAWGRNNYGQLGDGTTQDKLEPVIVEPGVMAGKRIVNIFAGNSSSFAIDSDGQLYAWGSNSNGVLGDGSTVNRSIPVLANSGSIQGKRLVSVSSMFMHTVALDTEGVVHAWGNNNNSQLGNGSTSSSRAPIAITGGSLAGRKVRQALTGNVHTVVLDTEGRIHTWGNNGQGQLGYPGNATTPRVVGAATINTKTISQIATGPFFSSAIDADGRVYTWGDNQSGQLGIGNTVNQSTPVVVSGGSLAGGKQVRELVSGGFHIFAIDTDGSIHNWGANNVGQLGNGVSGNVTTPQLAETLKNKQTVEIAGVEVVADVINYNNQTGEIELKVVTPESEPGAVDVSIIDDAGQKTTLANAYEYIARPRIDGVTPNSGAVVGGDEITILGDFPADSYEVEIDGVKVDVESHTQNSIVVVTPSNVPGGADIKITDNYGQNSLTEKAFTYNYNETVIDSISPTKGPVSGGQTVTIEGSGFYSKSDTSLKFKQVSSGTDHACGITINGAVYCWGGNGSGQIGDGTTVSKSIPVNISEVDSPMKDKNIIQISAGQIYTIALGSDGTVYTWGENGSGNLGDGTTARRWLPTIISDKGQANGKRITRVEASKYATTTGAFQHSLMLDSDGNVYSWGSANLNATTGENVPTIVSNRGALAGKKFKAIVAGGVHSLVLDTNGKLYGWGSNSSGQLGSGSTTSISASSPIAIATGLTFSDISAGAHSAGGILTNGNVYMWGSGYGNSPVNRSTGILSGKPAKKLSVGAASGGSGFLVIAGEDNALFNSDGSAHTNTGFTAKDVSISSASPMFVHTIGAGNNRISWGVNNVGQVGSGDTSGSVNFANRIGDASNKAYNVEIGGIDAEGSITQYDYTFGGSQIKFTTPPHEAGVVDISVIGADGEKLTLPQTYEYINKPTIDSVTPNSISVVGGDLLTITGDFPADSYEVEIDSKKVDIVSVSESAITVVASPHVPGKVDIKIIDNFKQSTELVEGLIYESLPTSITSVIPNRGPVAGGQSADIKGSGFYLLNPNSTSMALDNVSQVSAGEGFACAIIDKRVHCWGRNTYGQLGTGDTDDRETPRPVDVVGTPMSGKNIESISAGGNHVLALDSSKVMYAWGLNSSGQLGDYTTTNKLKPVAVNTGGMNTTYSTTPRSISAGYDFSIMFTDHIMFYGWGGNNYTGGGSSRPLNIGSMCGSSISAGFNHIFTASCYSVSTDYNFSWGSNTYGQLGRGHKTSLPYTSYRPTFTAQGLSYIHAGKYTSAAVNSNRSVLIWGGAYSESSTSPRAIGALAGKGINKIKCSMVSCIASSSNKIFRYDLAGVDAGVAKEVGIMSGKNVRDIEISPSGQTYYAIDANGRMYSWSGSADKDILFGEISVAGYINNYDPIFGGDSITVVTPPHEAGLVDISVIDSKGEKITLADAYEYVDGPEISSVSPDKVYQSGGDTVTVTGSRFTEQTKIRLGNNYVTPTFVNENTLTFTAPAAVQPAQLDVTVEDEFGQTDTLEKAFSYMLADHTLSSISPAGGSIAGGNTVTITGTNFTAKTGGGTWYNVNFGDQPATSVTYVNATTLRAVVPAGAKIGKVDVSVSAGDLGETVTLDKAYTYFAQRYTFINDPLKLAATEPGMLTLEARDTAGNLMVADENMEITLSSNSAGGFFARDIEEDEVTRWDYSSVIIPAGQSSISFYYRDSNQGTPTITARIAGVNVATQQ